MEGETYRSFEEYQKSLFPERHKAEKMKILRQKPSELGRYFADRMLERINNYLFTSQT